MSSRWFQPLAARGGPWVALLALSSPLLIALALVALAHRSAGDRLQAIPALAIGIGLLLSSWWHRRHRRRQLLRALRQHGPSAESP